VQAVDTQAQGARLNDRKLARSIATIARSGEQDAGLIRHGRQRIQMPKAGLR
jgi:hypothetical protein